MSSPHVYTRNTEPCAAMATRWGDKVMKVMTVEGYLANRTRGRKQRGFGFSSLLPVRDERTSKILQMRARATAQGSWMLDAGWISPLALFNGLVMHKPGGWLVAGLERQSHTEAVEVRWASAIRRWEEVVESGAGVTLFESSVVTGLDATVGRYPHFPRVLYSLTGLLPCACRANGFPGKRNG